jgi:hypothetical protein
VARGARRLRARLSVVAGPGLLVLMIAGVLVGAVGEGTARAEVAPVPVRVYAQTGVKLTDIVWTGRRFLYVANTTNTLYAAPPTGAPLTELAAMPNEVEETRCIVSPGKYGYPAGVYYCHAPDNSIYQIAQDGSVTKIGQLPDTATSDGALTFDTGGAFGHMLIAATGRSGAPTPAGGTVYTVSPSGATAVVASYDNPGGADEAAMAPPGFGSIGGDVLLTVDAGDSGDVVAIDASGDVRTIARLPDGPNPIAVITPAPARTSFPPPGFYVTDTNTTDVYYLAASNLDPYVGDVIVGTEVKGEFWIIRPRGQGFQTRRFSTDLTGTGLNLEAGVWIS